MNTIDLICGTRIDEAAALLVANAPARAEFNDITIRAKYATTKPADIVSRFRRLQDERTYAYRMSPKGKADAASDAADVAAKQATVDQAMEYLVSALRLSRDGDVQSFLVDNCPAVLAYGPERDPEMGDRLSRWLTGCASAEDVATMTSYAKAHGYSGPEAMTVADIADVLTWVDDFVWAADRVGVVVKYEKIVAVFTHHGWPPGVNCGEEFDGNDARNFAGYIVGQVLNCYEKSGASPRIVHKFIADWRTKFASKQS